VPAPMIVMEKEAYSSIERVKNRILDLQDHANASMQILLEMKMYNKTNAIFEKKFLSSVIAFAFEIKPKISSLIESRKMKDSERKNIVNNLNAINYYMRHFREFNTDTAINLLDALNEMSDRLGISAIVKSTSRTFEADIQNA